MEFDNATVIGNSSKDGAIADGEQAVVGDYECSTFGGVNIETCDRADPVCEVVPCVGFPPVGEGWSEEQSERGGGTGGGICLGRRCREDRSRKKRE